KANISTTFYRIKKEEEGNRRNKKEITTKFDEEPCKVLFYLPPATKLNYLIENKRITALQIPVADTLQM
ncbi:hypothetical protein, partial [Bacteroides sp.]|uniref:hypothetical protein n=1 Tax=Bacteroides sp. TaxID=29523 RepID=UPI001E1958F3